MATSVSRPRYNESNSDTPTNREEEEEQGDTVYAPSEGSFCWFLSPLHTPTHDNGCII